MSLKIIGLLDGTDPSLILYLLESISTLAKEGCEVYYRTEYSLTET
jgi:hypothetical protein